MAIEFWICKSEKASFSFLQMGAGQGIIWERHHGSICDISDQCNYPKKVSNKYNNYLFMKVE